MTRMPSLFCLVAAGLLSGCATVGTSETSSLSETTRWVAFSQEWKDEAVKTYSEARDYVRAQAQNRATGSWAVIMDVDETVLNNVDYQVGLDQRGEGYTPESWYAWTQKESAGLVPGTVDFIAEVNDLGGHVVFVTNRRDDEQLATENNLAALGLKRGEDFKVLLTRSRDKGTSAKEARFALADDLLAVQGYPNVSMIAYVGDTVGDKPKEKGDWAFFCIDQGGMYGEPCAETPGPG